MMKQEWKWLLVFALISLIIVGFASNFKFEIIEVQIYDTIYVFDVLSNFVMLMFLGWSLKNIVLIAYGIIRRDPRKATQLIIINSLLMVGSVFGLIYLVQNLKSVLTTDYAHLLIRMVVVLPLLIAFQIGLELFLIRQLSKARPKLQ